VYIIKIKHRGDTEETEYPIYNKEEAKENDITYIPWKDADTGDNALSDDGYVSKVLSRRDYTDSAGRKNIYMRFPFGYTFFSPKHNTKPLNARGRATNVTMTGKPYIKVQSKQNKMKALAMMFALKPDYEQAIEWALGEVNDSQKRKWKRTMKTETFRGMVREELAKRLTDHGLNEDYTLELLKEAIELAQGKKDISNLLKAVDNLQEMHGMKEKHVLKTTDTIEAFSSVKLIDELKEEEKSLTIQRTQIEEKKEESDE
tara:strand:+ start:2363 stop:3139 length:777 start_codon:yes stop_codon:yes gene_type:complete